ncbi:glycosyltransferase family 2 protein [Pseudomonadota bacterium]
MSTQTLAVITACHNRREQTLACLDALSEQSVAAKIAVEAYLMDDGSTDGTPEAVRDRFPDVHILHGDGSLFWNRGMYTAFAAAIDKGFDFYLWLNDDSHLYHDALEVLLTTHTKLVAEGHGCAIIGSAMQDPATKKFTYGGVKRHKSRWGRVKLERIAPGNEPAQCDASNGNCVLIPADVVSKVGNLDPVYLHRWGDHDYCFRALKYGCSVWLAPGYLGTCKDNPIEGTWEDISLPMMDRIRRLNSPRGLDLHDYAIYMKRHRGPWWPAHLIWPYLKIILQSIKA